jgi:hypothetical protein
VEDPGNPAMHGLHTGDRVTDEFYQMKAPYDRSKLDVLARVDIRSRRATMGAKLTPPQPRYRRVYPYFEGSQALSNPSPGSIP